MIKDIKLVKRGRLQNWLDGFAKVYKEKDYERLPYTAWCDLYKHQQELVPVSLECKEVAGVIRTDITIGDDDYTSYGFTSINSEDGPKNFGTFLITDCRDFKELFNIVDIIDPCYENAMTTATSDFVNVYHCIKDTSLDGIKIDDNTLTQIANKATKNDTAWSKIDGSPVASNQIVESAIAEKADKSEVYELQRKIDEIISSSTIKIDKEKKEMKGFNFEFGSCAKDNIRLSMYGLAVQNAAGEWVSYNSKSNTIINVDIFNIPDGGKYMFKMPVAVKDVKVGDIIIHNRIPVFVSKVCDNGTFDVTDVRAGETKNVIPTLNMFNFNFVTKVVSLFNAMDNAPTADAPFGNMLPFLMMSGDSGEIDPMVMLMMTQNQSGGTGFNPMMMYFMLKDKQNVDPMMLYFMMQNGSFCTPKTGNGN